ncbi:MAG: hypothetical protein Q9227_002054 [Pyrenula ochraceoflavens]
MNASLYRSQALLATKILPINSIQPPPSADLLEWFKQQPSDFPESGNLLTAAEALRRSKYPIAFPTETVYGLGADATRSEAVQGIYKAKQRPADNPLIVHFSTSGQLERFLQNEKQQSGPQIPTIYKALIDKFWPGPLTILLPVPSNSSLAPEVTHGLRTFGARVPSSPLARLLIALADRPIAAPSANASGKPSPTSAEHVLRDLSGKIELILDGGPSAVGVESTVVDGLSDPPAILRPGGIGIEEIRACGGHWGNVVVGYQDSSHSQSTNQEGVKESAPRAPGMKYRHYAPKAKVILVEAAIIDSEVKARSIIQEDYLNRMGIQEAKVGLIRTRAWRKGLGLETVQNGDQGDSQPGTMLDIFQSAKLSTPNGIEVLDLFIGPRAEDVARGLFSALRYFDEAEVDAIIVEGIPDAEGDIAAAVMNRLRKAAEVVGDCNTSSSTISS